MEFLSCTTFSPFRCFSIHINWIYVLLKYSARKSLNDVLIWALATIRAVSSMSMHRHGEASVQYTQRVHRIVVWRNFKETAWFENSLFPQLKMLPNKYDFVRTIQIVCVFDRSSLEKDHMYIHASFTCFWTIFNFTKLHFFEKEINFSFENKTNIE